MVNFRQSYLKNKKVDVFWYTVYFCATVCKKVCHMLSDRCLSVLSVTLVYCGQTVQWIKMKFGTQLGLRSGHIVLDGDPAAPPQKGHSPQFSAHVCFGNTAGWIKIPLGTEVGLCPGDIVLDGDPAPLPPKNVAQHCPPFRAMSIVAKRLDGSQCHLIERYYRHRPMRHCTQHPIIVIAILPTFETFVILYYSHHQLFMPS